MINKMNSFLLVFVLSIAAVALAQDKYTTRFDNVNIDEILNNRRLLKGYANCLLDKGPCSPDGAELKRKWPNLISDTETYIFTIILKSIYFYYIHI